MVTELLGGPLNGLIHEIEGQMMPSRIGLPDEPDDGKLHWYELGDDDIAIYLYSEPQ